MKNFLDIQDKVLLFDFDGTVVVTEILAKKVISAYFKEMRVAVPDGFSDMIVGRTWKAAVDEMQVRAMALGLKLASSELLLAEFRRRYQEAFAEGVPLVPGFKELLPELKAKSKFMGIVTGSERHEVEAILGAHGLQDEFERIWAFGDYEFSKPHPSPYLTALEGLNVNPAEVIVFEDSKAGMESAHLAKLKWVQIAFEAHAQEPDARSLLMIRDWRELQI